ncbi:hypothetical protein I862_03765 [endosymbiont of Acanthamoeba sp. UWC8]|uniref:DUF3035 domain-containing protein n=1 Tax=endosymbiont of Acanthamoeba sp. UWC8 TaxID=86106 RepID=UPI0004D16A66|nr:DUF3035 domain-containing protein [endosymbiont of Acanthamoeba sp. UWC8]AIF81313.1 hypothetical protein I862_03765 [endosymbiont of Acanthamoeba sp. UWC8]
MKKIILSIPFLILLTSCSNDVKSSLGLRKEGPDEFTVVSYPPLSIPPEFNLNEPGVDKRALPRRNSENAAKYTVEESRLLNAVSTSATKSAVKESIDNEALGKQDTTENRGFIRKTLGSLNDESGKEPVVDAELEKERISNNLKEGKPVNEGEVKNLKQKSGFSKLFG